MNKTVKWHERNVNESSILSSRIRLARNYKDRLFPSRAPDEQRLEIIDETARALASYANDDALFMTRIDMLEKKSRLSLIDRHLISPALAAETRPAAVFTSKSDSLSIMIMEEDHIRIQAIEAGDAIGDAYERSLAIDDMLDVSSPYAFDETLGYLTSCPTNAGTGLRASFMLHIPYLEINGQIGNIARSIGKFGFALRGTFGEGTESYGSVYQISNQVTLGLTEEEIINNIKKLTAEIIEKEQSLMRKDLEANRLAAEDKIWRTYGILTNARQIGEKEAIDSLSVLKMGVIGGLLKIPLPNIYNIIINIRQATLVETQGIKSPGNISEKRAEYVREALSSTKIDRS